MKFIQLIIIYYAVNYYNSNKIFTCKRNILESYRLYGNNYPESKTFLTCPVITQNCCIRYDEQLIFSFYNKEVKLKNIDYYKKIHSTLKNLNEYLSDFNFSNLDESIKKSNSENIEKTGILKAYHKLLDRSIYESYLKMMDEAPKALDYLKMTKEGFYCAICDYSNHRFINLYKKEIYFSDGFCRNILDNVLVYSFYMYAIIIPFLSDLVKFYNIFGSLFNREVTANIDYFNRNKRITKQVVLCINQQDKKKFIKSCSQLCENFRINQNVRAFDGDIELIETFIKEAKKFKDLIYPDAQRKAVFDKLNLKNNSKMRILEKNKDSKKKESLLDPSLKYLDISEQENELEIQPHDSFTNKIGENFEEIFDENNENMDTEYLFKTISDNIINLNTFTSRFIGSGIDYHKSFLTANFNVSIEEILKFDGIRKSYNYEDEVAERDILYLINGITESQLKEYHNDSNLIFKKLKPMELAQVGGVFLKLKLKDNNNKKINGN